MSIKGHNISIIIINCPGGIVKCFPFLNTKDLSRPKNFDETASNMRHILFNGTFSSPPSTQTQLQKYFMNFFIQRHSIFFWDVGLSHCQ
jgi:hypothetical protein